MHAPTRAASLALAVLCAVALAACGGTTKRNSPNSGAGASQTGQQVPGPGQGRLL